MDGVEPCDRKRCREENPQPVNDINNETKKRNKKKNHKNKAEGTVLPHPSDPVPQSQPIPMEQNSTTTEPIKKRKKRKNKQVQTKIETPPQSTQGLTLTKIPFKWPSQTSLQSNNPSPFKSNAKSPRAPPRIHHAHSSVICRACRQRGHRFEDCQRLKYLSRDDEICFFCGEIGHTLGKCSLSTAGGGRFANCLFCYAQGHFSINCPQIGFRINPKVAAASEPINPTVENEGIPVAEVTNV